MSQANEVTITRKAGGTECQEIMGTRENTEMHMFHIAKVNEGAIVHCEFRDMTVVFHNHSTYISKEVTTYFTVE